MFTYRSDLVLSKSWLNRALIIQSYAHSSQTSFSSDSDDVVYLQKALQDHQLSKRQFDLGQGGTSFRFFCFLISRFSGEWTVKAHPRLLERPQKELQNILQQLGVQIEFNAGEVRILSKGWKIPKTIICDTKDSSQFVSALLLNSWNLPQDLEVQIQGAIVSEDYLTMTLKMLVSYGMNLKVENAPTKKILIAKGQHPSLSDLKPEVDVSSAFSLASAAVIDGDVEICNWNPKSIQPDVVFLEIFKRMQINYQQTETLLKIKKQSRWSAVQVDLNHSPDLFPVLAVLCSLAEGASELSGAEQLKHKESNRLQKTKELLDLAGFRNELRTDGLKIEGLSSKQDKNKKIIFDPDHDHRMAMAAGLLKLAGFAIEIKDPKVVNKSYPSFWKDIGIEP